MSRGATLLYGALVASEIAATNLTGAGSWAHAALLLSVGLTSAAAIVVGARRHDAGPRWAWWLFAVGIALNATGSLVEAVLTYGFGIEDPFPSIADAFYLSLYPALAGGLALIVRRRSAGSDWATLVDTTTVTAGLGLLSWVFLIHPAADDNSLSVAGHVVSVAYPLGDVVLLAMVVRVLLGPGPRSAAFRFMATSLALFLVGDAAWAIINEAGWTTGPLADHLLSTVFLIAYALFGAAGLHPSVRDVGVRATPRPPRLSLPLLALLAGASLIAPGVLAIEVSDQRVDDGVAIVIGSVTLFLLVVIRIAQLLRQVERQAAMLAELASVDELTGLPNRRGWFALLPHALDRARRDDRPLSVAMLDLDHFKRFNDDHGHQGGDRMLKAAAGAWRSTLRASDRLARYGGEEFIVLLPDAAEEEALEVLERLRRVTPEAQTVSGGIATWDGSETPEALIQRADEALYAAKAAGRDRILIQAQAQPSRFTA